MFKNYLKIAIRSLARQKLFSMITIFGLALSMSICLLVLLRIKDQVSYDTFHPHPERTYRITTKVTNRQGTNYALATTPLPLATKLANDYNLIESYTRIYPAGEKSSSGAQKTMAVNSAFVDAGFFNLFGFTLQTGNTATALSEPNSIVISATTAEKFFGTNNPVGQIISLDKLGNFTITGVLAATPAKSHIGFDGYISMNSVPALEKSGQLAGTLSNWGNGTAAYTYVLLKPSVNKQQLANAATNISQSLVKQSNLQGKEHFEFNLQRLDDIILGEELAYNLGNTGSWGKVATEVAIAFIILLSACFNYTNLSVARSLKRGKEVGIRKVAGAQRYQVYVQFIIESILIALLSLLLAFVLLRLIVDYAPFAREMVPAGAAIDLSLWIWFVLFSIGTGLLAGALPAWILSSFKPVEVLKNLSNIKLFGSNGLRNGLIIAQFSLSLIITIFTLIFSKQFNYMASADPGFKRDHIITIPLQETNYRLLANDIEKLHGVVQVSATSDNPGRGVTGTVLMKAKPGEENKSIGYFSVDRNFVSNMELALLAGETFPTAASDNNEQFVLLNKKALELLPVKTPAEAIGKALWLNDSIQVQVAGITSDFYCRGLETPLQPVMLRYRPQDFRYLAIKTTETQPAQLPAGIEQVWKKYNPVQPFTWSYLKEDLYKKQNAWSTVSMLAFLAFMAITIACLGLLGIVVYTTETRRKEIGIRKVMGAGIMNITTMLSKGFLKLVLIAGCIALPLSYLMGYFFLNIFASRISIHPGLLLLSFAGIVAIAMLTMGAQIIKVAMSNPVKSLRAE